MMPVDMAEAEGHNLNETTLRCNNNLVYPYNKTDHQGRTNCEYSTLIVSREEISKLDTRPTKQLDFFSTSINAYDARNPKGPSPENFKKLQNKFLSIVPGDVIFYGGLNSDGTRYSSHHIGEIANVDYTMIRNATTINQLLQSVTVIECVFNGPVNYVIKRNMFAFGDEVDPLTVTTDTAGSWKFQTKNWQDPFKIEHLRAWEIRRLNSK